MSRLKDSLQSETELDNFREGVTKIWKDCKPFLKQLVKVDRGDYLYSGRNPYDGRVDSLIKKKVRTNRRPTDTNIDIHKDFDKEFQAQFGWPARSASLFTTGARSDAEEYGNIYLVFPIGNFKFCYSDDVPDLYILLAKKIEQPGGARDKDENNLLKQFFVDAGGYYGSKKGNEFEEYYHLQVKPGGDHGYWSYNGEEYIAVPSKIKDYHKAIEFLKKNLNDEKFNSNNLEWQPEIEYNDFYYRFFEDWREQREAETWAEAEERYAEWIMNIVNTYETATLKDAIESRNEVMVNCSSWYGFDAQMNEWHLDSYIKKFGVKGHKSEDELRGWWETK